MRALKEDRISIQQTNSNPHAFIDQQFKERMLYLIQRYSQCAFEGDDYVRKWRQGVVAVLVFFVSLALVATGDLTLGAISVIAMVFSMIYAVGLVIVFIFQQIYRRSRKGSKPMVEETAVKPRAVTIYECGHCKNHYSNSETCPLCGSPYRKIVEEPTKKERVEKWKPRPRSKTIR